MKTPTTPAGLRRFDDVDPAQAVVRAWTDPGRFPGWHARAQRVVRSAMPVLARALDRLSEGARS